MACGHVRIIGCAGPTSARKATAPGAFLLSPGRNREGKQMMYPNPNVRAVSNGLDAGTGRNLQRKMDELGVSRHELCRRTGISYSTLLRITSGDRIGMLDTWVRVCDALGIGIEEVLDDSE